MGINPVTETDAYIFVVENVSVKKHIPEMELLARLSDLLRGYSGRVAELVATVRDPSAIVYRPLESLLLPPPWYRGRAIVIGDAAHTTTPHMAARETRNLREIEALGIPVLNPVGSVTVPAPPIQLDGQHVGGVAAPEISQ